MNYEQILYAIDDGVLTITLNRPQKLNALTDTMLLELISAFDRADADDTVRAIIVTGAGRGFCAGADISAGAKAFNPSTRARNAKLGSPIDANGSMDWSHESVRDGGGLLTLRIFNCLKPVIAAVNGIAVGIGVTMQLAMDVRMSSNEACYGFVFARRGLVPEAASSWFLPRIVGISRALEWCYSGRLLSAQEALAGNLVSAIYPPADLLPAATAMAISIAQHAAPISVALTRQLMWRGLSMNDPMEAHRIESRAIFARAHSDDLQEGIRAHVERRSPRFTGAVSNGMPEFFPWWEPLEYR